MTVSAYDFDGTLTRLDTLIEFIRFAFGDLRAAAGFLLFTPRILLMKAGAISNGEVKQRLFSHFFKGMSLDEFNRLGREFARAHADLLRPAGIASIEEAIGRGDAVVIVSASIVNWVAPFFERFAGAVKVVGTEAEVIDGKLTGRFSTPNCYGPEKPLRLAQFYPPGSYDKLIAHGDSRGDRELLDAADEPHYKPFR